MLAPSEEHSEAAIAATSEPVTSPVIPATGEEEQSDKVQCDITKVEEVEDLVTLDNSESETEVEKPSEECGDETPNGDEKDENGNLEEKPEQVNLESEDNQNESPEVPQKVAFKENESGSGTEVELDGTLTPEGSGEGEDNTVVMETCEKNCENNVALNEGEKIEELICLDPKGEEVEVKVELKDKSPKTSGDGEVVEILNKLESLKTPEPEEVDSGVVRASFVDFNLDEPVEEESDEEEDDEVETREDETSETFVIGDLLSASNPELQKIREEQVRKWLKFEEENPPQEKKSEENNGECRKLQLGDGTEEGESGEMEMVNGTDDGLPRRVRFLTDQEGNLLISVFMSKLVHLFIFFLKVASGGYLDLSMISTSTGTSTRIPSPHIAPSPSSSPPPLSSHVNEPSPKHELHSCIINVETDHGYHGNQTMPIRLNLNDSHSPSISTGVTITEPLLEETSLASSSSNGEGNPQLVVSPPSLECQAVNVEDPAPTPSAPPIQELKADGGSDDEEEEDPEPPSIVLAAPTFKEPPKEKPPAPPADDIDEGCNSSDETLSVSSCNSMIEITPTNARTESVVLDLSAPAVQTTEIAVSSTTQAPTFQLDMTPTEEVRTSPTKEEEDSESNTSSQPASFIIHEDPANYQQEDKVQEKVEDEIVAHPTIDENNNEVDSPEELREISNDSELKPDLHLEDHNELNEMPELRRSTCSSTSDADEVQDGDEDERFISAVCEQTPSIIQEENDSSRKGEHEHTPNGTGEEEEEQQMVSLCIQEEHISSVALSIAKWESISKGQSTENLASSPMPHTPLTKCESSPCPKLVKTLATAIEQVNPDPVVPLHPLPTPAPLVHASHHSSNQNISYDHGHQNGKGREEPNNNDNNFNNNSNTTKVLSVSLNNALNKSEDKDLPLVKAPGWNCWGNKLKDPKPPPCENNTGSDSDEIIYAQPNHQAGSTMTSITNPSAILKQYPKPLSKGEIINWLKEGEIHRAGLLLNYGQSHHHAPILSSPHTMSPVVVSWFFGLISRHQAEKYLHGQPSGTFLVRISTRIWGYTLSYQATNGRTKHFLISAVNPAVPATLQASMEQALPPQTGKQQRMSPFLPQGRYAFIGTNMTPYGTLVSLIRHHSHAPITKLGGEKLLNPCPGGPQVAGLESLFK